MGSVFFKHSVVLYMMDVFMAPILKLRAVWTKVCAKTLGTLCKILE